MAMVFGNGGWYWRKMIDGVMFNRPTKTDDKKLAEQMAKKWEHEGVQAVVYDGERPVTIYKAIKGFLEERENTGGYGNACTHMNRWKAGIPNGPFKSIQKHQVQVVVSKIHADGYAHNTIAVAVRYWNALVNYCERKKLSPGPKIDKVQQKRTRFRVVSPEEEAAMLAATCPNAKYRGEESTARFPSAGQPRPARVFAAPGSTSQRRARKAACSSGWASMSSCVAGRAITNFSVARYVSSLYMTTPESSL